MQFIFTFLTTQEVYSVSFQTQTWNQEVAEQSFQVSEQVMSSS